MKKSLVALGMLVLVFGISACDSKTNNEGTSESPNKNSKNSVAISSIPQSTEVNSIDWPKEFGEWQIPIISNAKVISHDNRSVDDNKITQGINVVTNLSNVSKTDFDSYCKELESKGYLKGQNSLEGVIVYYEKKITNGIIKLTLTYSDKSTTIVANNSAVKEEKENSTSKSSDENWPEIAKSIPPFTKGKFKESVKMGEGMVAISYTDVSTADLDWYRGILKSEGFIHNKEDASEGYIKLDAGNPKAIGFVINGESLQLIIANNLE